MLRDLRARIRAQIERLERETELRFGDPRRPLLLSVRSGSAISMPGVLDTFLDVGINEEIAEGLAARSGSPWGAWDAYRRFLQFWGMGHDLERNRFDALMRAVKAELGVEKKAQIPATAMKQVAQRYRRFILEQGVAIADDPALQLERCVQLVLRSWDAEKARVYRAELQIAEEWGTAVVVQNMVYGNLNARSGTGVVLTCDPRRPSSDVRLYGDFIVQGQGDDVVSGLVQTHPISEDQRRSEWVGETCSLEKDFQRIHRSLFEHATVLIRDREMFHQELEFTFESDDPSDLYILQTRDRVMAAITSVAAFEPSESLEHARLATGIGAGGGALSGRLAHTADDVEQLRLRYPGEPIILARPDAVPDDIPLILRADGLVTSLGGATSHAALVTQQLGRTCVVGCRQLVVDEPRSHSRIGGRTLSSGDLISISGIDGSVYLGRHPCTQVRRHRLG
jgi:pyruvate,orthophosphate dikinase